MSSPHIFVFIVVSEEQSQRIMAKPAGHQDQYDKPPPYSPYYSEPTTGTFQQSAYPATQSYPTQGGYQVPGYAVPVIGHQIPSYGSTAVLVQQQPDIIFIGGCPACRIGTLEEDFTCLGVLMGILFFPLGIICCLALRQKRCTHCGLTFD